MVAFDETGNTGPNLLDPSQPVFVLASVHMSNDRATGLVQSLTPPGAREVKFATLRRSAVGQNRVLSLLQDGALSKSEVRIAVYHKSFMVTTKIVDMLVETWHHRMGVDLYENAANLGLANLWHSVIPVFCSPGAFDEWQKRFVALVRDKTPATIERFFAQTDALRRINKNPDLDIDFAMLSMTRAIVDEGIHKDGGASLDPAIPTLVQLAAEWTAAIGPFDLVHDESMALLAERRDLRLLLSLDEELRVFDHVGVPTAFPIQAPDIRFANSRDVPQLQLADVFAGAAARLFRTRARRETDPFAEALLHAGIANLVTAPVWPDISVTPEELDAARRPGKRGLEFIVDLIERRRSARDASREGP